MTHVILFYVFGILILASLIYMLLTRSVIHAAYGLALILISIAGLYILLGAEYLAASQLFLYAGGIVVLLIFGIMVSVRERGERPTSGFENVIPGVIVGLALLLMALSVLPDYNFTPSGGQVGTIAHLGVALLTKYLIAFEVIAYLLLMALVAATYLAKKSSHHD